jgi:hypothetical protein
MKKILIALMLLCSTAYADTITWDLITTATFQSLTQYQTASDGLTTYLIGRGTFVPPFKYKIEGNKTVNGVNWGLLSTNLSLVTLDDVVYYNGSIYAIGGKIVAKSLDGNTWATLTQGANLGNINNSVGIFNNKMIAIYQNSVFQSTDGIDWETLTHNAGFAVTTTACNLVEFDNKLWRFSGTENDDMYIYNTDNGVDWVVVTGNAFYGTHPIKVTADANYIYGYDTLSDYMFKTTDGINITPYNNAGDSIDSSVDQMFIVNGYFFLISPSEGQVYIASIPEQLGTETPTITETWTALPTVETSTPTITPTVTPSMTKTVTKTITATHSITETKTPTLTITQSWTPSDTITPTNTPTPTRTNTPETTPTNTVTVTPILTLEPILRYVSTDYDNHRTTLRVEWTKYIANNLQYTFTVYDNTYQHQSTVILNNNADISPDLEWLTHDIIGLRYNYCYNMGVTITSTDWSEPIYANTIVVCPYESPTPFAGTPTATNSPDCNPPTATPSPAITMVQTVDGLIAYENWDNLVVGDTPVPSSLYTDSPVIVTMMAKDNNPHNQCLYTTDGTLSFEVFGFRPTSMDETDYTYVQQATYSGDNNSWQIHHRYNASNVTITGKFSRLPGLNRLQNGYIANTDMNMYWSNAAGTATVPKWEIWKSVNEKNSNAAYGAAQYPDSATQWNRAITFSAKTYTISNYSTGGQSSTKCQFSFDSRSGAATNLRIDDLLICKDNTITVTGLDPEDCLSIIDAVGNTIYKNTLPTTGDLVWDVEGRMFPLGLTATASTDGTVAGGITFIVTAPNGMQIYQSEKITYCVGGSIWAITGR